MQSSSDVQYVQAGSMQKPVCCECKRPLNMVLLQGEDASHQMCAFCAEKKLKEVRLLQLKLLNEKKRQNVERLTMMTAGIPSQSSTQSISEAHPALPAAPQQPSPQAIS